jgi:hypothetical protein
MTDMIEQLVGFGEAVAVWLWKVANTNFMMAFLTALAGAAAGAYGAQFIVERSERKRRMLEEIRSTNAAIMVAFAILNTYCSVKNQHVDVSEKYLMSNSRKLLRCGRLYKREAPFRKNSTNSRQIFRRYSCPPLKWMFCKSYCSRKCP